MKPCILVTGGAGFIGSHLVDDLFQIKEIKDQYDILVIDDLSGGFPENINENAEFIHGSICDQKLVESIFEKHDINYVFHLAAYAAEGLSPFIQRFNYTNNLIGSINLMNASVLKKVKCFVFTSSIAVYGKNQLPMKEDLTPHPEDSYGIAKNAVEQQLKVNYDFFKLPYIIFRPHNVYGERQNIGDKYRNVIGIFMNQIMQEKPLTIFGDGLQTRAFTYIRDISPIMARSILQKNMYNQIFNLGADTYYSVKELATETVKAMTGREDYPIRNVESRKEVIHAYSDHEKCRVFFPEMSSTTLATGLKDMAEWAKKRGAQKSKTFDNIEISKNLPPVWLE
jgi:UDP-glucose 4-epimerase